MMIDSLNRHQEISDTAHQATKRLLMRPRLHPVSAWLLFGPPVVFRQIVYHVAHTITLTNLM